MKYTLILAPDPAKAPATTTPPAVRRRPSGHGQPPTSQPCTPDLVPDVAISRPGFVSLMSDRCCALAHPTEAVAHMLSWPATTTADRDRRTTRPSRRSEPDMNNQHPWLSQVLAQQRITEQRQQAAHARVGYGSRPLGRRRRSWAVHGWWRLARWPAAAQQPARRPHSVR